MTVVYRRQRSLFAASLNSQFSCWNISKLRKTKMLQNSVLQTYHNVSLKNPAADMSGSLCFVGFGNVRLYSIGRNPQQALSLIAERTSRAASSLVCRSKPLISMNAFDYGSLQGRIKLSSYYQTASLKRPFSTKADTNRNDDSFIRSGSTSALGKLSVAWNRGKNISKAGVSASKDSDASQPSEDVKEAASSSSLLGNANNVQKSPRKKKQPSIRKKKEDELTGSSTNGASQPIQDTNVTSEENIGSINKEELINSLPLVKSPAKRKTAKSSKKAKPEKVGKVEASPVLVVDKLDLKPESRIKSKSKVLVKKEFKSLYPPSGKSVLVVESLTKAKVIQKYLGDMFEVLPSYGHVRDLAARSGSVRPDDDFSMVWEVPSTAWTHLKSIKIALNGAENLILASDPDREGEAIAWHIIEMLQQQGALHDDITVARVVFNEVTEASIKNALQTPRVIDVNLVQAYLARRALDYLIGFNISPLLWRKLPGCQSAGRVQSAALSLICDREMEIDAFEPREYWTVEVQFNKKNEDNKYAFLSSLTHVGSEKVSQLSISSREQANDIENNINSSEFEVLGSKRSKVKRNPPTPFITSSLQQDAANKLHFSAMYTMKLAQKLYEGVQLSDASTTGLITYMRTDGLHISDEAAKDIRSFVIERYGGEYTPDTARTYFKKIKNAQEAHEAIRPTNIRRLPSSLEGILDEDALKLYALIWVRTMACQMEPVKIDQIQLDIRSIDQSVAFRSTCSTVDFFGYQTVYRDMEAKMLNYTDNEDDERKELFKLLCDLNSGDTLCATKVKLSEHHTQPPSRFSEASLVKKLEELGIGRPSTYASTLKVLQDRHYVQVKSRVLYPEFRGRMVSAFLSHHFSEVTDYSFTADMETELDNVSAGLTEWKGLLRDYWTRFSEYCELTASVHIHQVEKMLEKTFGDFLFASLPGKSRTCPICLEGTLIFKVSRFGAGYFIGCNQHPKCKYIAKTLYGEDEEDDTPDNKAVDVPKILGLHTISGEKILLKTGPYGSYVQLGEDRKGYLPKRASLSQVKNVKSITLEDALELLKYPITLGNHPGDNHPVVIRLGKSGFTIRHRSSFAPLSKNANPTEITLEKALKLLQGKDVKRCGRPKRAAPKPEEAMEDSSL
ncbi:DNA topoisomerase 1-like [Impatiens glandulifera]|uniref:DNA topoisomerase 1-like n=1 Tax=Impatiens glandulifera TaxID=253017 RepID=UPI001FB17CBA|nr:DNA topoisomerase 1-like [Impatiens glandulifera]XP_047333684.1 DNA topoisomerase 1-like [Impatiens glandulifera]